MRSLFVLLLLSFTSGFTQETNAVFLKGCEEFLNGKTENALKSFRRVLRKDSLNPKALMFTGAIKSLQGKNAEALCDLTKSIKLDSLNAETYHYRSLLYYNMNEINAAINDISKAIALDPLNTGYIFNRAKFYVETKNYKAAIEDGNYMLTLDQVASNPAILYCMAEAYTGMEQFNTALEKVNQFIAIDGKTGGYVLRGDIYFKMQNYDYAVNDYEYFLNDNDPTIYKGDTYLKAGNTYLKLKKNDRACELFKHALNSGVIVENSILKVCDK
jgi:tetratricopeptide (TPR) repeat protein